MRPMLMQHATCGSALAGDMLIACHKNNAKMLVTRLLSA